MANYRHYLLSWNYTRPFGDPECLELLEALEPDIIWDVLNKGYCIVMIRSQLGAWQLGQKLIPYFDPKDKLLIMEVCRNNAWYGLDPTVAGGYLGTPSLPRPVPQASPGSAPHSDEVP